MDFISDSRISSFGYSAEYGDDVGVYILNPSTDRRFAMDIGSQLPTDRLMRKMLTLTVIVSNISSDFWKRLYSYNIFVKVNQLNL